MKKKVTVKEMFENDNLIITKIMQGQKGKVRIDAKRRFHIADEPDFFSEWCSKIYADKLFGKSVSEHRNWQY